MDSLTLFMVLGLPEIWPLPHRTKAAEKVGENSKATLFYTVDGRIEASVESLNGDMILTASSPVIEIFGEGVALAIVSLTVAGGSKTIELYINGSKALPQNEIIRLTRGADPRQKIPLSTTEDKVGNAAALRARKERVNNYRREGLTTAQEARFWEDLKRECRLLSSSIKRLKSGDDDEIGPVSTSLRKLIGKGKGNRLLQDCAGFARRPLNVWARPTRDNKLWEPIDMGADKIQIMGESPFALSPMGFQTHSLDLDTWLAKDDWVVNRRKLTNLDLLHEIADKIGVHSDWRDRLTVETLQTFNFNSVSALTSSLVTLGDNILALANTLIVEAAPQS